MCNLCDDTEVVSYEQYGHATTLRQIADQLRKIADAEGIQVDDASLMLVARAGDGSMRDAQSALDQVLAFSTERITADLAELGEGRLRDNGSSEAAQ